MNQIFEEHRQDADFRYREEGNGVAVVRCIAHGSAVSVPRILGGKPVTALGDECFASVESGGMSLKVFNGDLQSVELPDGIERIGRAAFRGCSRLSRVTLPDSLVAIEDLAFSCTSLDSLRLPRACVHLGELALRTGPESLAGAGDPYLSKLDVIDVESGNEIYCACGNVLCRRLDEDESDGLEVVLCPGKADEVRLGRSVVRVALGAFAGTYELGTLAFCSSIAFSGGCGLATRATCATVQIDVDGSPGEPPLSLSMPSKALQKRIFASTENLPAFDLPAFLSAYDEAISQEEDQLLRAKLMVARLARPLCLSEPSRAAFEHVLESSFDAVCVQFGARNYRQGFDGLLEAGLLNADSVAHVVGLLTARCDATSAAYVLELKRSRIDDGGWDYAL